MKKQLLDWLDIFSPALIGASLILMAGSAALVLHEFLIPLLSEYGEYMMAVGGPSW